MNARGSERTVVVVFRAESTHECRPDPVAPVVPDGVEYDGAERGADDATKGLHAVVAGQNVSPGMCNSYSQRTLALQIY